MGRRSSLKAREARRINSRPAASGISFFFAASVIFLFLFYGRTSSKTRRGKRAAPSFPRSNATGAESRKKWFQYLRAPRFSKNSPKPAGRGKKARDLSRANAIRFFEK